MEVGITSERRVEGGWERVRGTGQDEWRTRGCHRLRARDRVGDSGGWHRRDRRRGHDADTVETRPVKVQV